MATGHDPLNPSSDSENGKSTDIGSSSHVDRGKSTEILSMQSLSNNEAACFTDAELEAVANLLHEDVVPDSVFQAPLHGSMSSATDTGSSSNSTSAEPMDLLTDSVEDSQRGSYWFTPQGTRYWTPTVANVFKPSLMSKFRSWEDVVQMYETYAEKCRFNIKLSTVKRVQGSITHRYIVCAKAGQPWFKQNFDSLGETSIKFRKSTYQVTDCRACIRVKFCKDSSMRVLYFFKETHNHMHVPSYNKDLTNGGRKLDFATKDFIHRVSVNKIGPAVAHKLPVSLKGGHHNVRGTPVDYKNFSKSIHTFIGDKDSHLLIDKLNEGAKHLPNFSFKYSLVNGELRYLFWADQISKLNYKAFSDVVAFDATYQTNKYNLIFVPFTGVDNNKRCVTFGVGLLFNETIKSYCWLLNAFLEVHGKQPALVLTDQDPAMRQAVPMVFTEARHRLCMWHIMKMLGISVSK